MKRVPISLLIDDPSPVLSVYYAHHKTGKTDDGRDVIKYFPNSFLDEFCQVVRDYGIKGKFSVVPCPGNCGNIIDGIDGVNDEDLKYWLDTVKKYVVPSFSIGPEMLTHNKAVDLESGDALDMREVEWSNTQDRTTLTPYISKALSILKEAGFDCSGVTSPWSFGIKVEDEYTAAISKAVYDVYGKKNAWYFLRGLRDTPNAKPWVALEEDGRILVSVPATTRDKIWQTIHCTNTSEEYISRVADELITKDGKDGEIIKVLETGGYPILVTHWQSLASNGLYTGVKVLREVAKRINDKLSDRVEWMTAEEIMELVISNKENFPKR